MNECVFFSRCSSRCSCYIGVVAFFYRSYSCRFGLCSRFISNMKMPRISYSLWSKGVWCCCVKTTLFACDTWFLLLLIVDFVASYWRRPCTQDAFGALVLFGFSAHSFHVVFSFFCCSIAIHAKSAVSDVHVCCVRVVLLQFLFWRKIVFHFALFYHSHFVDHGCASHRWHATEWENPISTIRTERRPHSFYATN